MVDWLTLILSSVVISMAVLAAAYIYLYVRQRRRRRQVAMGLWALGWTAYLGLHLGLLAEIFLPLAMLWCYLSLALLGLSAFLLWAGTRHFVGSPPFRRAYAWGALPVICAAVAFLGLEERPWLAIPIFLFAGIANLFTAASLYHYSRSGEGLEAAIVAALGYGLWGVLELLFPFVHIILSPRITVLALSMLLANGLTLGLAISLLGLHIQKRGRRSYRQARQLKSLRTITAAVSQVLDPDEVLNLVAHQAAALVGAETVVVSLISEDGTRLLYKAARGRWAAQLLGQGKLIRSTGICGWVMDTRGGFYSENLAQDGRATEVMGEIPELETAISAPMVFMGKAIGAITMFNKVGGGSFTRDDLEQRLQPLADQAAIAIQNARLFEETKQRTRQLEALTEVGRAIGSTLNLDEVLQLILRRLEDVVPYDAVSLWLREGGAMRIRAVQGFEVLEVHMGFEITIQDDVLSQEMVSTQRPLILADARQDERFRGLAGTDWVRSWLGVPLLSKGEVIGLVTIDKREPSYYTAEMAELALVFGQQAAMAIENARLYEETKRRAEEMTALYYTSLEIPTNLPDLLWAICDRAARLLDVEKGGLYLYDEAREELELVVSYKLGRDFAGARIKLGEGLAGRVVLTGQHLIVDDYSRWDGRARVYEGEPFATVIGLPLKWQERVIGSIVLAEGSGRRMFTPEDERLLSLFAQQAAVAIENARLYEGTMRHVEELTALHNIDVAIASTLDLDEVLRRVYEQVSTVMDVTAFHIALYDEEKDELYSPVIVDRGKWLPPQVLEGGLSGWVVRTREPLWIEDWDKERDTLSAEAIALGIPTCSLMVLPLIARDKIVGVMSAQSYEPYAFDEGHRRLFSGIASQVAVAIENAWLFEETDRRLAETCLLQEVMQAATSILDFDEVLTRTLETLHRTLGIEYLNFALPDGQGTGLTLHPSQIGYPITLPGLHVPLDGSVTGRVYQSGEPQIVPDVRELPYYFEGAPEIRSELAVPVKVAGQVIAVLNAESPDLGAFSEGDLRLFSAVAAQLGVVLDNTRLYEEATRRLAEARLTQEVVLAAASTLDFDLVLERAVKALYRALAIASLGFLLPDEQEGVLVSHPSLVGFVERAFRVTIEGSLVGQAYRTGQPVLVQDAAKEPAYFEQASDVRSVLTVPVWISDRVVAVLYAESLQVGAFGEDELRLFTTIAGQLGVTLDNARLYQRLEAQAAELAQAYGELQEINRLRTELVQNVGHELRTPLSLIQGYIELLLEGDLGRVLDSQLAALQIIRERSVTLSRLIHNLTMLQPVPREMLSLVPISVVEVVQHALAEFGRFAENAGITFLEELPVELPSVTGDRERLELVFGHLVDNAIKFSPDGGTITVRAWADESQVYVSVADEGIGIAPDHLSHVFERFYQVDGTTKRRFGGMGVGLALVWEIIEAHGGTVMVESESGEGSAFTVALPQVEESSTD
ncbi:MAG: GAF domain-containing protein [Chloroflexota bacterium]|nr:GAF domain-containing protein [Chloroflexota bacterium]